MQQKNGVFTLMLWFGWKERMARLEGKVDALLQMGEQEQATDSNLDFSDATTPDPLVAEILAERDPRRKGALMDSWRMNNRLRRDLRAQQMKIAQPLTRKTGDNGQEDMKLEDLAQNTSWAKGLWEMCPLPLRPILNQLAKSKTGKTADELVSNAGELQKVVSGAIEAAQSAAKMAQGTRIPTVSQYEVPYVPP